MTFAHPVTIGGLTVANDRPFTLIAGPCALESREHALEMSQALVELTDSLGIGFIYKSSFDKANRTSANSPRGLGIEKSLPILAEVREARGCPVLTDVHTAEQCAQAAEAVDVLQIPAFLCRQTDLLLAAAATGRPVLVKKGQFMAPHDMRHAVEKLNGAGPGGVLLCERGTSFGYNDLVVDLRALVAMRGYAPVCFDATHAVQHPGAGGDSSSGDRAMVTPLARAAAATGIDALFVEVHPDPDSAPCDGPSQIDYAGFDRLLGEVRAIDSALRACA